MSDVRMEKGKAFYLTMYEKDGAKWSANEHQELWCQKAEDYERRLGVAQSPGLREALELQEAAEMAHVNCSECDGDVQPENCQTCFPIYDKAREARRAALGTAGAVEEKPAAWEQVGWLRDYDRDGEEVTEICMEGDPGCYAVYRGVPPSAALDPATVEALKLIYGRCSRHIKNAREHGGASPIIVEIREMARRALAGTVTSTVRVTEKHPSDAPVWYSAEQADAWANGYNKAIDDHDIIEVIVP